MRALVPLCLVLALVLLHFTKTAPATHGVSAGDLLPHSSAAEPKLEEPVSVASVHSKMASGASSRNAPTRRPRLTADLVGDVPLHHAAFEEIYAGRSRDELVDSFTEIYGSIPSAPVVEAHLERLERGEFRHIPQAQVSYLPNGKRSVYVPSHVAMTDRPFLDYMHNLEDDRVVRTRIAPEEIPEYSALIIESAWLFQQIRNH